MKRLLQLLTVLGIILAVGVIVFLQQRETRYISRMTSSIVTKLQAEQQLVSVRMTVSKILESQKDLSGNLFGSEVIDQLNTVLFDDRMIMTIEGVVSAGVDLSKISDKNIHVISGTPPTIVLTLPEAEIFDVYLTENTKPFERSLGRLTKGNVDLETQMRNQAIGTLRQEALSGDLLEEARLNAQTSISKLLNTLQDDLVVEYN